MIQETLLFEPLVRQLSYAKLANAGVYVIFPLNWGRGSVDFRFI